MKLRRRIMILAILLAALPLMAVILLSGREIGTRFATRDTARVEARIQLVKADLTARDRNLATLLDTLAEALKADNNFRLALLNDDPERRAYLAPYATRQMGLMRLDLLQIQDEKGRILSAAPLSGAQGLLTPGLPTLLSNAAGGRALMQARSPEGAFLALVRMRPIDLAGTRLFLLAGTRLDRAQLEAWGRRNGLTAALIWPGGVVASSPDLQDLCTRQGDYERTLYALQRRGDILRSEALPFISEGALKDAWLLVVADQADMHAFIADMRRRLWLLLGLAVLISALLAVWLTRRITEPLAALAEQTATVDLDRLDVDFASNRQDEVGDLARLLGQMTARLRQGVEKLRAAEQRATLGEVARQVNHDIRNGITPLRHVLRHLGQVATDEPERLPAIFQQRRANLEDGLAYLEQLADRYARLTPVAKAEPCHLDRIAQDVLDDLKPSRKDAPVTLVNRIPGNLPVLTADPIALRRIFTNLVRNALESLPPSGGAITLDGAIAEDPDLQEMRMLISVSDNGSGIAPENLDRIFQDFFTTRPTGTGLGLSNVRRLVGDLGGRITATSVPERGTTFTISLPPAAAGSQPS